MVVFWLHSKFILNLVDIGGGMGGGHQGPCTPLKTDPLKVISLKLILEN